MTEALFWTSDGVVIQPKRDYDVLGLGQLRVDLRRRQARVVRVHRAVSGILGLQGGHEASDGGLTARDQQAQTAAVRGGNASGAGGGGGGVIGDGVGGPGGPGGNTDLNGKPGTFPGGGGGGGGAIGPGARGGEGGGGGEYKSGTLAVQPGEELYFHVGEGGAPGKRGEDTWVSRINPDGSHTELLRAKSGVPGRDSFKTRFEGDVVPFKVTSALISNAAEIRGGLIFMLGGGWDNLQVDQLPVGLNTALVLVLEPILPAPNGADITVEFHDPYSKSQCEAKLWVEYVTDVRPLRMPCIYYFTQLAIDQAGVWSFVVKCNGTEVGSVPLTVHLPGSSDRVDRATGPSV